MSEKLKRVPAPEVISQILGSDVSEQVRNLSADDAERLATILSRPDIGVRLNRTRIPYGVTLSLPYGQVLLDDSFTNIESIYINGTRFSAEESGIDAVEKMISSVEEAKEVIGEQQGRQKRGRKVRSRRNDDVSFEKLQEQALADLSNVGLSYDNLFDELSGLLSGRNVSIRDIADELFGNSVAEDDIPQFLVYESQYRTDVVSQVYGLPLSSDVMNYTFEPIQADDTFLGRIVTSLGETEAEYDAENGVMRINGRLITNLPSVDENGIFSNGEKRYIPHYIGYFAQGDGTRVERLRVIDPVKNTLNALKLQYDLSGGDIKFQTILDVTRNLADYDTHPFGEEILDTLRDRKVVLHKKYGDTNSLLAEYAGKTDELGAVALTMLDDDAKHVIDPYGTSNGSNMGTTFYLTHDSVVNEDGSITPGQAEHSLVGELMDKYHVSSDNFNRNQMSFNALLTSTDAKTINVAYAEFGMFNADDAGVMTETGAKEFKNEIQVGDKVTEMHGNKSVVSRVITGRETEPELQEAAAMVRNNPNVHMFVSPISLASRLNMGVVYEGLDGEKQDCVLADGTVVKDGVTQMMYLTLPQTADHKSKDYSVEGDGRKYSTLFRYVLSSKIGDDLYKEAFISEDVRAEHIDEVATAFQRLGVSFKDDSSLVQRGNVQAFVDSPVIVEASDFALLTPAVIRLSLMNQIEDGKINISLGDMSVTSALTGEPIVDKDGYNVLPIRVANGQGIPYRYTDVFKAISLGNQDELEKAYAHAAVVDYRQLTRKNNLLKNIDTMTVKEGAATTVIVPDPTIKLGEVRSGNEGENLIIHRDPCIQSGNVISVKNIGGGAPNVLHVNPLMISQVQGDFDGDTMGERNGDKLPVDDATKEKIFSRSSVYEQLNHYGEVFLGTDSSHFKAAALVNGIDTSDITFEDGKSNMELARLVEDKLEQMVKSPASYGAYAVSFTDVETVKETLGRLADDGIKGDREQINHYIDNKYTPDENRAILKALIAKSEWTGLAGAITNDLISGFGDSEFDADLVRVSMDVTASLTQSVLQMKKNADKLPVIDKQIKEMKTVVTGKYGIEESRERMKAITNGLLPESAIEEFVDIVEQSQIANGKFGYGVINGMEMSTTKLAYVSGETFGKSLMKLSEKAPGQSQ